MRDESEELSYMRRITERPEAFTDTWRKEHEITA